MKEFQSKISVDEVFSGNCEERVEMKDWLSNFCQDDVRAGKWFLCYC
ncbi:hypothetical protein [[Clostridium] polysaccharolyticum]|uniref:Uncharacterized protein n=1 Tax=[Clostridium] polysaccharolyticum TaxID=29364 RepID=A0A1I0ACI3_9FIRM|nr:hypothetical protein [[Clostridium] polysaccharolyticum]SES91470.1 hypothetical protein SAMN04487772_10563 [[Clostridium] polysaccharolyticum]